MSEEIIIDEDTVEKAYLKLKIDANEGGYHLNNDLSFAKELTKSLLINEKRYGYPACPCRLASGKKEEDLDIICPCDYRDEDLNDYGACYCALYVTSEIIEGKKSFTAIPERRNIKKAQVLKDNKLPADLTKLSYPVYRCKVCGYLCAREHPPEICPVCKAKKERFENFL